MEVYKYSFCVILYDVIQKIYSSHLLNGRHRPYKDVANISQTIVGQHSHEQLLTFLRKLLANTFMNNYWLVRFVRLHERSLVKLKSNKTFSRTIISQQFRSYGLLWAICIFSGIKIVLWIL